MVDPFRTTENEDDLLAAFRDAAEARPAARRDITRTAGLDETE
jgi:hypothetical protein